MADPAKDAMRAFGVISTIFTMYVMVETAKAQTKNRAYQKEHKDIQAALKRIEAKLK